jgi:hypothetical protein
LPILREPRLDRDVRHRLGNDGIRTERMALREASLRRPTRRSKRRRHSSDKIPEARVSRRVARKERSRRVPSIPASSLSMSVTISNPRCACLCGSDRSSLRGGRGTRGSARSPVGRWQSVGTEQLRARKRRGLDRELAGHRRGAGWTQTSDQRIMRRVSAPQTPFSAVIENQGVSLILASRGDQMVTRLPGQVRGTSGLTVPLQPPLDG